MLKIESKELGEFVCIRAEAYCEPYYYWKTSNGICIVPFGDFVEVYESLDDMLLNS